MSGSTGRSPEGHNRNLFWCLTQIQDQLIWALADTGSAGNIIDKKFYDRLPEKPPIRPAGSSRLVAGNGTVMELLGFITLIFRPAGHFACHEVQVVGDLDGLDFVVGATWMKKHGCDLLFVPDQDYNLIGTLKRTCDICDVNMRELKETGSRQLLPCYGGSRYFAATTRLRTGRPGLVVLVASGKVQPVIVGIGSDKQGDARCEKLDRVLEELKVMELDVSTDTRHRLVQMIDECLDAFAANDEDVGQTGLARHRINTGDSAPFRQRLRPVAVALRDWLRTEIERLLKTNIIERAEPGECPYASPVVIVRKKDGSHRLCVDYRRLNDQTVKDAYPLPRIQDLLHELANSRYFSSLDLLMGYHQIEVEPADRAKTAFITFLGLFVYRVMPFGLCNAPATFQRLIDELFRSRLLLDMLAYLDDLIFHSREESEHLDSLRSGLKKLISANLKCKPRKCRLFQKKILYLGYEISEAGLHTDPEKVDRVLQWPFPETGLEMLSFLGLCNYYRTLIESYAEIADPLY